MAHAEPGVKLNIEAIVDGNQVFEEDDQHAIKFVPKSIKKRAMDQFGFVVKIFDDLSTKPCSKTMRRNHTTNPFPLIDS